MTKRTADLERFWAKVDRSGECWTWTAAITSSGFSEGYGSFWTAGAMVRAHRWIFEQVNGPLDPSVKVDHLCRNTLCVRLDHLEAVTNRVNVLRGVSPLARQSQSQTCPNGHEYGPDNLGRHHSRGRQCLTCTQARELRKQERRKRQRRNAA